MTTAVRSFSLPQPNPVPMNIESTLHFPDESIFRPGPIESTMNLILIPVRMTIIFLEGVNRLMSPARTAGPSKNTSIKNRDELL